MQCHVEMTPEMIASWCEQWEEETRGATDRSSIQSPAEMLAQAPEKIPAMRRVADQLYRVWLANLKR